MSGSDCGDYKHCECVDHLYQRIRELEAALEQSKEMLSAARVKYEQPMMRKALGLQQRIRELEEALELMLQRYGYDTCEYVQQALVALSKARGER